MPGTTKGTWFCPECSTEIVETKRRGPHLSGCRRKAKAEFFYDDVKDPKHKHPLTPAICLVCGRDYLARTDRPNTFCNGTCAQSGSNNSAWVGAEAAYVTCHARVYKIKGKADSCPWGCVSDTYHWANLTGNYIDIEDYVSMCASCHGRYDGAREKWEDHICPKGHSYTKDGYYSRITLTGEVRQCKQCSKDRVR